MILTNLETRSNMQSHNVVELKCRIILFWEDIIDICFFYKEFFFPIIFFKTILAIASPDKFLSNKQHQYSTTECCFITFSFRVMFNERLDLFPLLNKIFLLLSPQKFIESFLSMKVVNKHNLDFFNKLHILVAIKYIIWLKPKVAIL